MKFKSTIITYLFKKSKGTNAQQYLSLQWFELSSEIKLQ